MAAYCEVGDLLNGSIPLPTIISAAKVIEDAADEIDAKIGFRYVTPIDLNRVDPETGQPAVLRPVRLTLKRINAALATGRLILAVASPEENAQLHAYGLSLITEALMALDEIRQGQFDLDGAVELPSDVPKASGPQISNLDAESAVEAFYDRVVNPNYTFGYFGNGESFRHRGR